MAETAEARARIDPLTLGALYQLVLIPLVTVAASAVLQDEQITASFAFGSVFVLVGVYVGIRRHATER